MDGANERRGWRGWGGKAALAVGGLLVGGVLVGTLTASAADTGAGGQTSAPGRGATFRVLLPLAAPDPA